MQVLLILKMRYNVHHLCYSGRIVYWLNRFWNYHTDPIHNYICIQFSGSNLVTFFLAGFVETLEHLFVPVMLLFFIHILWKINSRKKSRELWQKPVFFLPYIPFMFYKIKKLFLSFQDLKSIEWFYRMIFFLPLQNHICTSYIAFMEICLLVKNNMSIFNVLESIFPLK